MVLKRITNKLKEFKEASHSCKTKSSWCFAVYRIISLRFKNIKVYPYKCFYCDNYHIGHIGNGTNKRKRYAKKYAKLSLLYEGR